MSHRTIRQPSGEERLELKRIKPEEIGRVAMRAHMMLLSDRGLSAFDIADLYGVTHPTVYKWIGRFNEESPDGLFNREGEGRPRKIDGEVEREIEKLFQTNPTEEGENASRWTTLRIAEYLEREYSVDVHGAEISAHETVRETFKRLMYSWTRPRRQLCKGPDQ
jgi:transposase